MADVILVGVIIATIVIAVRSLGLYEPGEKTDLSKFDGIDITKYEDDDWCQYLQRQMMMQ